MAQESSAAAEQAWEKRDSRGYGLVDKQTGEVVDAIPILVPRRHKLGTGFFMGIQEAFVDLARTCRKDKNAEDEEDRKDLSADAWRILFFLLGRLEYENHLRVGQSEIVRALDMHKSSVSRALRQLTRRGILKPTGEKAGRSSFYKLDTDLAWRGKARNRPKPARKPRAEGEKDGMQAPEAAAPSPEAAQPPA